MLHKLSLTNVPMSSNPGRSHLPSVAALLGLAMFCQPALRGANPTTVGYLQQVASLANSKTPTYPIPAWGSTFPLHAGMWGPFNLPGYGSSVWVGVSGDVPDLTWFHQTNASLHSTDNGLLNWGADTNVLNFFNSSCATLSGCRTMSYTLTFYFDGVSAPNPSDLFLVVDGLCASIPPNGSPLCSGTGGSRTAATVMLGATASAPGTNVGEYTGGYLSSTNFDSATLTFSSLYKSGNSTDPLNTGWDLWQPNSTNMNMLQLRVTQLAGDGVGFTLGYRVCSKLVLYGPDFGGYGGMYNIDPATGAATNFLQTGPFWGIAFSPMSPTGALDALWYNDAELFTINPITGTPAGPVATGLSLSGGGGFGGALAADPTTGILYGLAAGSTLVSVSANGQTPVGPIAGLSPSYFYPMAFNGTGDLFIVAGDSLFKIAAPITATSAKNATKIGNLPASMLSTSSAGFTINPWSGTAYIAVLGVPGIGTGLFTMTLTGASPGTLTKVGSLPGIAKSVITGLTFMEGVCPVNTSAVVPIQTVIVQ
jgi:hypothetical protein